MFLPVYLVFRVASNGVRDPTRRSRRICKLKNGLVPVAVPPHSQSVAGQNAGFKARSTWIPGIRMILRHVELKILRFNVDFTICTQVRMGLGVSRQVPSHTIGRSTA